MRDQPRLPLLSRLPGWAWVSLDTVVALLLAAGFLGLIHTRNPAPPGVLDFTVALAASLPLAVRRLWPRAVFVVVLIGGLGMREFLIPQADPFGLPLVLYTLATRSKAVPALVAAVAVTLQGVVEFPLRGQFLDQLGLVPAIVLAAWTTGTAVRQRRLYTEQLAAQAEERARAEAAKERLRIARELHDVIGHSLSTIAVQAGIERHVGDAAQMRRTLGSIEETSRSALRETRRLLGVLREDGPADLAPAPGFDDLDDLLAGTRAAGLEVELRLDGEVRGEMELTVYRIVQEALTNVLRHAGAERATVLIERQEERLVVEITDDGANARERPYGHGLNGLRERVRVFGGEFEAGVRPVRGFRVRARLPL
ncbi:sensor histidine kinase [Nonomuraea sp. MG754425]|uniref:sensor histidine kinase n=1 Tax=Nonomuraea sp. MG754425 TaxID=2570319 RepID=UPI001EFFB943|nr:histidine kinase [Nonomuraea sp. MG754425]MCF6473184.1 sensor histidine kinase [Nonomuraea sp. MG754425]